MPASPVGVVLQEGVDYYWEAGKMVFTAEFHKKRGHCCGSGCRHCPYPKAAGEAGAPAQGAPPKREER